MLRLPERGDQKAAEELVFFKQTLRDGLEILALHKALAG